MVGDLTPEPIIRPPKGKPKMVSELSPEEKTSFYRSEFLRNVCMPAHKHSAEARRRYDYEWMIRDLFRRGFHFSRYQPSTNTIMLASRQTAKIPINFIAAQMRSIRNQVTSFKPKFEVLPRYSNEESDVQARYSGRLLDYVYEHLGFKRLIKETVTQGLMYSIGGPWEIYYDEERKEVRVWLIDPFDFYCDPYADHEEDCEYMIVALKRPLSEITTNREFDEEARKEVKSGEARLAVSEYKQFMIQTLKMVNRYSPDENPSIILFKGSFKIRDEETGKVHIRKVIWTDQNTKPLYWEDTDDDQFDYVLYHADLNPKEILGESWMKHTMPINRVIDSIESSIFDYGYRTAKSRIIVDRDSGVRAIHNVHGEIISKNRGADVRAMDMPTLPIAVSAQVERMYKYLEDIGGVHDATLGRLPTGIRTGIGVAELKQSDSTNQSDLVDNLEDFLSEVGIKILRKISKNYKKYQIIRALGHRENEAKYFAVIGEGADKKGNKENKGKVKIGPDWLDLAVIGQDNQIRVTIGSWLGYTKEAMQEKLLKFAQLGLIDQKTTLRLLEFGNIDEIVQQSRMEMLLKRNIQNPQNPNQPGAAEQDQYGLAMTENDMMFEGKNMPVDAHDDHVVHVALHQEVLGTQADELVKGHIEKHQIMMSQSDAMALESINPAQPVQPTQPGLQPTQTPPMGPQIQAINPTNPVNPINQMAGIPGQGT